MDEFRWKSGQVVGWFREATIILLAAIYLARLRYRPLTPLPRVTGS